MHPMEVGTVVYYQLKRDGTVLYGINGVQEGALVTGANTNVLPWAVVEIYGSVQSVGFVGKPISSQVVFCYIQALNFQCM